MWQHRIALRQTSQDITIGNKTWALSCSRRAAEWAWRCMRVISRWSCRTRMGSSCLGRGTARWPRRPRETKRCFWWAGIIFNGTRQKLCIKSQPSHQIWSTWGRLRHIHQICHRQRHRQQISSKQQRDRASSTLWPRTSTRDKRKIRPRPRSNQTQASSKEAGRPAVHPSRALGARSSALANRPYTRLSRPRLRRQLSWDSREGGARAAGLFQNWTEILPSYTV